MTLNHRRNLHFCFSSVVISLKRLSSSSKIPISKFALISQVQIHLFGDEFVRRFFDLFAEFALVSLHAQLRISNTFSRRRRKHRTFRSVFHRISILLQCRRRLSTATTTTAYLPVARRPTTAAAAATAATTASRPAKRRQYFFLVSLRRFQRSLSGRSFLRIIRIRIGRLRFLSAGRRHRSFSPAKLPTSLFLSAAQRFRLSFHVLSEFRTRRPECRILFGLRPELRRI